MSEPGLSIHNEGRSKWRARIAFATGLALVLGYWWLVRPLNGGPGYFEDYCWDLSRRAMAENLTRFGKPVFTSDLFMAPFGMSVPFFSWSIERDWVGAWFWQWNKNFPFIWAYFLASLLFSWGAVGWLLTRMGVGRSWAWALSTLFVGFNVPRHFTIWYHMEHLSMHWVIVSLFLDAWIWQRLVRHQRWSWTLELWRVFLLIAVLGTPGYFWGAMALEWILVRASMIALMPLWWQKERADGTSIVLDARPLQAIAPLTLSALWLTFELQWFLPLIAEMKKLGPVDQGLGWWAHFAQVLRPLWLDPLAGVLNLSLNIQPIDKPETVVSIGWLYWIPLIFGVRLLRRKRGGPGVKVVLPFLLLFAVAISYFSFGPFPLLHDPIRALVPFMSFFRVACRWGLMLSFFAGVMIALSWPELSAWGRLQWQSRAQTRAKLKLALLGLFLVLSLVELQWLAHPVLMQPPLDASAAELLNGVAKLSGTSVLDMPFCVAGGNGVCTAEQCPNYPDSTVSGCFSNWHEKKVYGLYQARLTDLQCQIYNKAPYTSWFSAWKEQRCLDEVEWLEFCGYLDRHPELSAILVYPDIWRAAGEPSCRSQFEKYLGTPVADAVFLSRTQRGGAGTRPSRVIQFEPRCQK